MIDPLSPRKPMDYVTSKRSSAGSVDDSTTVLNCESTEDLDIQIENNEFVDAVENVTDIPFASI